MEWIAENRWWLLIGVEVSFWILLLVFLVLRYGFQVRSSGIFLWLLGLNLLGFLTLGIIDYQATGQISTFQIVVIVVLIYSVTYGPKDKKRLDRFMRRKIAQWKKESLSPEEEARMREEEAEEEKKKYGRPYARSQRRGFYIHLILFVAAHLYFAFQFGVESKGVTEWVKTWMNTWNTPKEFPFQMEEVNRISRLWVIVLLIDAVNAAYYTLFPRQRKETKSSSSG
ncbi:hypothetical protein [Melghirimyces algeriensis]|uniref:Integral membrane protein n=1 Tax=Melghirimyces algeriensis TaxID=910412 RepID=A0A521FEH3_9BACL|nr:hypothetical protein [Melghirimyces algeriensis]SMO94577.1 hypothetical protein SAMN06264849_11758 [Melghirimyces algeriensis]